MIAQTAIVVAMIRTHKRHGVWLSLHLDKLTNPTLHSMMVKVRDGKKLSKSEALIFSGMRVLALGEK